jgi:hypothetical protein
MDGWMDGWMEGVRAGWNGWREGGREGGRERARVKVGARGLASRSTHHRAEFITPHRTQRSRPLGAVQGEHTAMRKARSSFFLSVCGSETRPAGVRSLSEEEEANRVSEEERSRAGEEVRGDKTAEGAKAWAQAKSSRNAPRRSVVRGGAMVGRKGCHTRDRTQGVVRPKISKLWDPVRCILNRFRQTRPQIARIRNQQFGTLVKIWRSNP